LLLRCRSCGGEFTVDRISGEIDDDLEQALGCFPADRV